MEWIRKLATTRGFYAELYNRLKKLERTDPETYEKAMLTLESQDFGEPVDMSFFLDNNF